MKMILDNPLETIIKDFDSKSIKTTIIFKDGTETKEVSERLCKYSLTVAGYKHQLELDGFKYIK